MFQSKKSETSFNDRDIRAFLEEGCEFEGKLTFSGVVRLNGKFKGDIATEDTLIIGDTAQLEGSFRVGVIIVGGKITGDIIAKHRVEVQNTGVVQGKIIAPTLITHEGAQILGSIQVSNATLQAHSVPSLAVSASVDAAH